MSQEINHIAIIMDGNRRFAQQNGLNKKEGHSNGRNTLLNVLDWCKNKKIKMLTIYAFSTQNFKRPKDEKDYLYDLLREEFQKIKDNKHKINIIGIKVNFIGRLNLFPKDVQDMCSEITNITKKNSKHILNVCLGYGGREEIVDAVKKISSDVKENKLSIENINEEKFNKYLYCKNDPDLVIRTSGEIRTSNFLPWQTVYSEWFFIEKNWPDFSKKDFLTILKEFKEKRNRRYGK